MKVAVVNCGNEVNRGVAAIHQGTINLLARVCPGARIELWSVFDDPGYVRRTSLRHTLARHRDLTVHAAPMRAAFADRAANKARAAATLLLRTIVRSGREEYRGLEDADLVVTRSSPLFSAASPLPYSTLRAAQPLLAGLELGRPVVLGAECYHPMKSSVGKAILRHLMTRAAAVFCRDPQSLGVSRALTGRGQFMLDFGFWLEPRETPAVRRVLAEVGGRDFFVLTPRDGAIGRLAVTELQARIARPVQQGERLVPVVVPHALDPEGVERDDREAALRLARELPGAVLVLEPLGPDELCSLYSRAVFVVGSRVHSVILALRAGTPALSLLLDARGQGILDGLGLGSWTLGPEDGSGPGLERKVSRLLAGLARLDRRNLLQHVLAAREVSEETFRLAMEQVLGGPRRSGVV